ncbi:hypothetical protein ID47_01080 [Candidatus Paracaedibacter acanthamoebae]|uniref:Carrier domain-containing protein n=2 Tax=Candidatus Odyssella acanthamoebae TaxID=91604 RepID=A0A077AR23_9PROT|nr:hypothetical protein ID47_01080 [Candidatus Paracaedibacter acanthamoebae]
MLEHPELICRTIDLDPKFNIIDQLEILANEIGWIDQGLDQIAYRDKVRYSSILAAYSEISIKNSFNISREGIYLITGGFGGLGLKVAGWLVQQGAQHLLLIGRNKPNQEVSESLQRLKENGATISTLEIDVADPSQVEELFLKITQESFNLKGIIHAAGIIEDGVILNQTIEKFEKVCMPKIAGAWNLHSASIKYDFKLDFFVMFSSISASIGNPGQSNYAYANAFLDNLSYYRRNQRMPALSINWGPWAEVGMATNINPKLPPGLNFLHPNEAINALKLALELNLTNINVAKINWQEFLSARASTSSLFGSFNISKNKNVTLHKKELTKEETESYIIASIRECLSKVLPLNIVEELEDEQSFLDVGMDSLMALQFKGYLQNKFEGACILSPTVAFEYPTIPDLAQYIYQLIVSSKQKECRDNQLEEPVKNISKNSLSENPKNTLSTTKYPTSEETESYIIASIRECLFKVLPLNIIEELEDEQSFLDVGMDSLMALQFKGYLQSKFEGACILSPTVAFEYPTIPDLAQYIYQLIVSSKQKECRVNQLEEPVKNISKNSLSEKIEYPPLFFNSFKEEASSNDIAIIGMSCFFPGSSSLEAFWDNLIANRDLIKEVPKWRWDWQTYYGDKENQTKVKWGGFIEDIDKFDNQFFNISPKEAELMDPQQRILLQAVWQAVEDAGYNHQNISGSLTGVFIGASTYDYAEILQKYGETSAHVPSGNAHSILANRVSYYLNLKGPSEAIDTACSSSLVALHRAIKAIQTGDCEMAIAGGVNALLTPSAYISFTQAGMLCEDGRCKSFDKLANGYVRGEGVGVILLKPLDRALKDKDIIYGVVKGTAANHGGRVSSLTVPNANAQANVVLEAIKKARINTETISYIETHGTGTSLGDPIEINGLKKAFRDNTTHNYCGLGTVKTNIGHLEPAAGIAGVIKVLLSMRHGKLPGIIHFNHINPYIELKDSPFYIVDKNKEWQRLLDKQGNPIPRRAGVSSFGFGGVNAHVVLEEIPYNVSKIQNKHYYLIAISAKHAHSLKQKCIDLNGYLERHPNLPIEAVSYTLNTGRRHFNHRLALVVCSVGELKQNLTMLQNGQKDDFFQSTLNKANKDSVIYAQALEKILEELRLLDIKNIVRYKELLETLANLYIEGYDFDWSLLHQGETQQKISLPAYPFLKHRHWISDIIHPTAQTINRLHPLIDNNVSTLALQSFEKLFTGQEFYLQDHRINGRMVLPGAAYLEMARAAGELSSSNLVMGLRNVTWIQPIEIQHTEIPEPKLTKINLLSLNQTEIDFEVSTNTTGSIPPIKPRIHAQGKIVYGLHEEPQEETLFDVSEIKGRCNFYKNREEMFSHLTGVLHGPSLRTIKHIWHNDKEALAELCLPDHLLEDTHQFLLHPSLIDGAIQATYSLGLSGNSLSLPFTLGELKIIGKLSNRCYAYVTVNSGVLPRFQIKIMDEHGRVQVDIKDFIVRPFQVDEVSRKGIYYYEPVWESKAIKKQPPTLNQEIFLVWDDEGSFSQLLRQELPNHTVSRVINGQKYESKGDEYQINVDEEEDYLSLLNDLDKANRYPTYIIYKIKIKQIVPLLQQLYECFYSLFHLSRSLIQQKSKKRVHLLFLIENDKNEIALFTRSISGFIKTLELEQTRVKCRIIEIGSALDLNKVQLVLQELDGNEREVRYSDLGLRLVKDYQEKIFTEGQIGSSFIKQGGIYLITGGAGGLGLIFAKYLSDNYHGKIILTGRSKLDQSQIRDIEELKKLGGNVVYLQSDITKRDEVEYVLGEINNRFGKLNGIIHSAGVIRDSSILKKKKEDAEKVLDPKLQGTFYLDELTQFYDLDFFVLFSSVSSVIGNSGQCDYAFANGFMDGFASYRNQLFQESKRYGKTIVINWPLWEEGGMQIDEESKQWVEQSSGMLPIKTQDGIRAFISALNQQRCHQYIVLHGYKDKIKNIFYEKPKLTHNNLKDSFSSTVKNQLRKKTEEYLKKLLSESIKFPEEKLDTKKSFASYGVDSIILISLNRQLEKNFKDLPTTLLFEYETIESLTNYFIENQIEILENKFNLKELPTKYF